MSSAEPADAEIGRLLEYIRRTRRFDFSGYKRNSLERRISKRMAEVGCETYADYQDHLEVHPDEFGHLFNTILINVTSFFRDRPAWEFLASCPGSSRVSPSECGAPAVRPGRRPTAWRWACATPSGRMSSAGA
jgi:chemotaxis methyl-accepting protein methylase